MDSQGLYREEILEHYRSPQNFGKPQNVDVSAKQTNPFCGDEIEIFLKWAKRDRGNKGAKMVLEDVGFEGIGCAISIASASFLTDFMRGKSEKELTKFSENDMLSLLGIEVSETRKKCALLAYATLQDCLK